MHNLTQNSFLCIYFNSLHVSSNLVLIIRRINCINTKSAICHSVSVTHTRCCIDTIDSPDDEHEVAQNVYRIEINT
jgi:hypothetical protein